MSDSKLSDSSRRKQLRPLYSGPFIGRWLRRLVPLVMIGLAVHLLLPQLDNLGNTWQTIQQMPQWLVALAIGSQIISYSFSGYLLTALAVMLNEHLAIRRSVLITLAGGSIGIIAGGIVGSSAAIYRWTRASGVSRQTAGLCSTLPPLFNNFLLAVIAIWGLLHLLLIHKLTVLQGVSFGLVLAILTVLVTMGLWGVTHPVWLLATMTRLSAWWAKVWKRPFAPATIENSVNQFINTWLIFRSGGWRGPALGAILYTGFDMLTLYFLFIAAGHPVRPGVLLTGYGLPLLIGKAGFIPGGVGIVEATMTAIYVSMGIPTHLTVVVTLAYRLISFWFPILLGFWAAVYLQRVTAVKVIEDNNEKDIDK
ncbi:MAG: flippase-like domain-containing protein [Anaerolineales bacterium]|nr:flippase-like domain-containing protein [Anaerolineales bacterium]